jgi:hypothetical protein
MRLVRLIQTKGCVPMGSDFQERLLRIERSSSGVFYRIRKFTWLVGRTRQCLTSLVSQVTLDKVCASCEVG